MKTEQTRKVDIDLPALQDMLCPYFGYDPSKVELKFIQEKYYPKSKYHDPRDPIDPQYRVVGVTLIEKT